MEYPVADLARLVSVDCDLDTCYLVTGDGEVLPRVPGRDSGVLVSALSDATLVLFEIASPVNYRMEQRNQLYHTTRWMLRNMATASALHAAGVPLLVSPSSAWTLGYGDKDRWAIAEATQRTKHERDAWAMIFFYRQAPHKWVEFPAFLSAL